METAKEMQNYITSLAEQHGVDLSALPVYFRLEQEPYLPLAVQSYERNHVIVQHEVDTGEGIEADLAVIFFTGYKEWVPTYYERRAELPFRMCAIASRDGSRIEWCDAKGQAELAMFCRTWARELEEQGWKEKGKRCEQ